MSYVHFSKCNINDTDTTTRQGLKTNFKNETHSFHTANITYKYISSQPQFFITKQTKALS